MAGIGIIGLGRVGRGLVRALWQRGMGWRLGLISEINRCGRPPGELVDNLAYLLAHDTVAGPFPGQVASRGTSLIIDGREIPVVLDMQPGQVDWLAREVNVVVEATGDGDSIAEAAAMAGGLVDKVLITRSAAPAQHTLVRGVNFSTYDPAVHHAVSCSTCTANAVAPVLALMNRAFGVERASLTTVHPALSGDSMLDGPAKEFAAGRSGLTVRPVPSEVARTCSLILPELAGRLTAMSLRVPTLTVNALLADIVLARPPARDREVVAELERAAGEELEGIMALERGLMGRPRPAADFAGDPRSALVDLNWLALNGSLLRILIWHDNEHAYCQRVVDTLEAIIGAGS